MPKKLALDDLKVLELTRVITGSYPGRILANHGATVIHVESEKAPDSLMRSAHPYKDNIPGINRGAYFSKYNVDKYGITLNLTKPDALELMKRLVRWADVFVENNSPGTVMKYGLDYENVKKIKPDIIMVSTCLMGQRGVYANIRGFGAQSVAMAGYYEVTGYPDEGPVGPEGGYTDLVSHQWLVAAILASVDYRNRTGIGQYLDHSQFEAGIHFLAPMILDYTFNGRLAKLQGNRDASACPHGCYRCQGDDRWCTIAVRTDKEWEGFCRVVGEAAWTGDPRFATFLDRKRNEDALERLIEKWTVRYSPEDVMSMMQAAGVPAGIVARGEDLLHDPQLKWRSHFKYLKHQEMGYIPYDESPFRLSETPSEIRKPSPCLGEDNAYVAQEILGLSDEEFVLLMQKGVFE